MKHVPPFAAHHRSSDDEWQGLSAHLLGVGALARTSASKVGLDPLGELLGLLHDLGKYSQAFQSYLKSAIGALNQDEDEDWVDAASLKGKVDHSTAGAQMAWQALGKGGQQTAMLAQVLALCIASHHSGLIDCIASDTDRFGTDAFSKRMSKAQDKTHLDEAINAGDRAVLDRCAELLSDPSLVSAFFEAIKRIAQHNNEVAGIGRQVTLQQFGLLVRFLFSCLIDADRVDTANFEDPRSERLRPAGRYADWGVLTDRLEAHLVALTPSRPIDGLRRDISEQCRAAASRPKGVYTLTVPTGGGKTLASLRFALHHAQQRDLDRIIYVIPFTSIIDQNAQVVRDILEPNSAQHDRDRIVLEHHGSVTPEQQTWREKILCENWDAPVVYTTMVQFLESLFGAGTRGARRMHQLGNAVLVFDEVQTLPIKCVHLFNNAIDFLAEHCNATVVLCTATQPLLHMVRPELGAMRLSAQHELMDNVQRLFDKLERVEVKDQRKAGGWTDEEIAALSIAEIRRTGSCLVIVNTKAAARRIFELACPSLEGGAAHHLSTDMCSAHRKQGLSKVRARLNHQEPILCVSTQLIEAGVDVDFRTVIRFVAGLDSIAQAAGRCNRNGLAERGVVHIVNPQDESLDKLPDIQQGRDKALRVLDEYKQNPARYRNSLIGPDALESYYRYYFFDRQKDMSYSLPNKEIGHDDTLLNLLSSNRYAVDEYKSRNNESPAVFFQQAFMTAGKAFKAIDAPTQGVIVPYGDAGRKLIADLHAAFDVAKEIELLRAAQQYTVNVFPHVLQKLQTTEAVRQVKPGSDLRILCLDQRYYDPQFGLSTVPVALMENLNV